MKRLWPGLLLMGLSSASAHLNTPWVMAADALRQGEHLLLVRVVSPEKRLSGGTETPIEVLADLSGPGTQRLQAGSPLVIWQEGPHHHVLTADQMALLPVSATPAGGWRYGAQTRLVLQVRPGDRNATEAFARQWRSSKPLDLIDDLDSWLTLIDHPSAVARDAAYEMLAGRGPLLEQHATAERLDRLVEGALLPGRSDADRLARLRLAEVLGGAAGAEIIAGRFDRLPSDRLRAAAAGILARSPTAAGQAVLARCAQAGGSLGARCSRLVSPPP